MEGEEEHSEDEGSFRKASIPKRMAIVLAGGLVNIIFGLIVYFVLMSTNIEHTSLIVDSTIQDYAAKQAGIQQNDEIIKINGKNIHLKSDLEKILNSTKGEELVVTVKRNGNIEEIKVIPTKVPYKTTGIYLEGTGNGESTKIITLEPNSVAEESGIQANDKILKINGIEVRNQQEIMEKINEQTEGTLILTLQRGTETREIEITPKEDYYYYLGIYFKTAENNLINNVYYAYWETVDFMGSLVDNIKMIFTGKVQINQMMGPVGISEVVTKTSSIADFVYILALVSVSLGVTNLLPVPALDGGKLLLLLIEAIRRKPFKEKTEINVQLIGMAVLITFAICVTYNDILRLL